MYVFVRIQVLLVYDCLASTLLSTGDLRPPDNLNTTVCLSCRELVTEVAVQAAASSSRELQSV